MQCRHIPKIHLEFLTVNYCVHHDKLEVDKLEVNNYVCMLMKYYIKNVCVFKFHRSKYQWQLHCMCLELYDFQMGLVYLLGCKKVQKELL